jgi:hypothetical protein
MESVDKKVKTVLKREQKKLTPEQKAAHSLLKELGAFPTYPSRGYSIPPRDTIGRRIRYNTPKK